MIDKTRAAHYVWGAQCDGWHLVQHAELSVIHEHMPPGTAEVRHHHRQARQFFFVLSGTATFELSGQIERLGVQQGIEVPPGVTHQIRNESSEPLEFLVISQPAVRGDRVLAQREGNEVSG